MNIFQVSESYYERTDARTDERTKEQAYARIQKLYLPLNLDAMKKKEKHTISKLITIMNISNKHKTHTFNFQTLLVNDKRKEKRTF